MKSAGPIGFDAVAAAGAQETKNNNSDKKLARRKFENFNKYIACPIGY